MSSSQATQPPPSRSEASGGASRDTRQSVSIVLPAFNEAAIVKKSLAILCDYMRTLEASYRWEIILVNDGSRDDTGRLAQEFARQHGHVTVLHHPANFGMGQALISAFRHCRSDYVITLDLDLSFAPDHIAALLQRIRETRAKIVVASPFVEGGKISNVPWLRKVMTVLANRLLARASNVGLSSITGVGRVYDGRFIRSLTVKSTGMDINPEIIYKAMLLRARIVEIPAHLDWSFQLEAGGARKSSMRIQRQVISVFISSFLFRPVHFFVLPGLVMLLFAAYVNVWVCIHWWTAFGEFAQYTWFLDRASAAIGAAYQANPHTFVVGGVSLLLAIQLLSLGILALQNKKYFEDMFHLGASMNQALHLDENAPS